jgi:hypothetical protein
VPALRPALVGGAPAGGGPGPELRSLPRVDVRNSTIEWRRQGEVDKRADVREAKSGRYLSRKPCPECGKPMWALQEPGFGVRHQCEDCRITVLFGGAIARWHGSSSSS